MLLLLADWLLNRRKTGVDALDGHAPATGNCEATGFLNVNYQKGVTHGVAYEYDTHVPLLFYGWKIQPGSGNQPVFVNDIAPTVADWLRINAPNGASGKPVQEIRLKK